MHQPFNIHSNAHAHTISPWLGAWVESLMIIAGKKGNGKEQEEGGGQVVAPTQQKRPREVGSEAVFHALLGLIPQRIAERSIYLECILIYRVAPCSPICVIPLIRHGNGCDIAGLNGVCIGVAKIVGCLKLT